MADRETPLEPFGVVPPGSEAGRTNPQTPSDPLTKTVSLESGVSHPMLLMT